MKWLMPRKAPGGPSAAAAAAADPGSVDLDWKDLHFGGFPHITSSGIVLPDE